MITVSTLERRIDRHMRDSNEQINLFKHELQSLKPVPKTKIVRQSSEAIKANSKNKRIGQISKAATKTEKGNEKSSVSICQETKASKKFVSISMTQLHVSIVRFNYFVEFAESSKRRWIEKATGAISQRLLEFAHFSNIGNWLGDDENQFQWQLDANQLQSVDINSISAQRFEEEIEGFHPWWWRSFESLVA